MTAHRATAIALTGMAFLGVGLGTSYAIRSVSERRQGERHCIQGCPAGDELRQRSQKSATVAQVAFALGVVSLGGAAYLWLTEPSAPPPDQVAVRPWQFDVAPAPGGATAWLGGSF